MILLCLGKSSTNWRQELCLFVLIHDKQFTIHDKNITYRMLGMVLRHTVQAIVATLTTASCALLLLLLVLLLLLPPRLLLRLTTFLS